MAATVEIAYGRNVHQRMMQTLDLEPLRLWGKHADIVVFLEWTTKETGGPKVLARFIIFALHPQLFLLPWGKRHALGQDTLLYVAHKLAKINISNDFYQNYTGLLSIDFRSSSPTLKPES
jgi:hypothetical protein